MKLSKISRILATAVLASTVGLAGCSSQGDITAHAPEVDWNEYPRGSNSIDEEVILIISGLTWENAIASFSLATGEPPSYGVTINQKELCEDSVCHSVDADAESNRENAVAILALVDYVDWVQINSPIHPCPTPQPDSAPEATESGCVFEHRFQRSELEAEIAALQDSWQ